MARIKKLVALAFFVLLLTVFASAATKQLIVSGQSAVLNASTERYSSVMGEDLVWNSAEVFTRQKVSTAGTISDLKISLDANSGIVDANSYRFTFVAGSSPTDLLCDVNGVSTTCEDTVNSVSVIAGTNISLQANPFGSPNTPNARYSFVFTPTVAGETILTAGTQQNQDQTTSFLSVVGTGPRSGTEFDREIVFPTSGVLKNLFAQSDGQPGSGGDNFTYTVRLNSSDSNISCQILNSAQGCNNTTGSVPIVAGDTVALKLVRGGPSPASIKHFYGLTFVPDVEGEFIIPMSSDNTFATLRYAQVTAGDATWRVGAAGQTAAEQLVGQDFLIKSIYVERSTSFDFGTWTFSLFRNRTDTDHACSIGPSSSTCNTINDFNVSSGDLLMTRALAVGGLFTSVAHISYLGFIEPTPDDTCTPPDSGPWVVDCADNCQISSEINLANRDLSFIGPGNFFLNTLIRNIGLMQNHLCTVRMWPGSAFSQG